MKLKVMAFLGGALGRTLDLAGLTAKSFVKGIASLQTKMSIALVTHTGFKQKKWFAPRKNATVSTQG